MQKSKCLKFVRKRLNEQFPVVRDRRYRREVIDEIVRIFQDAESVMKIQVRRESGRRHFSSFCEIKIMTISPAMINNGRIVNLFILYFRNDAHPRGLQSRSGPK